MSMIKSHTFKRTWIAIVIGIVLLLPWSHVSAGQQIGKITNLMIRSSDGLIYVFLDGASSGKPACATFAYWMIKAESTQVGKQQYAMLLGARLNGKTVKIAGSNQCTRWPDGEDINVLELLD